MKKFDVDVAVIGAGSAGLAAFRAAKLHGARALLIERGPYGTTCARVGCMPTKLLIAAAEAAHGVGSAVGFGIHAGSVHIDGSAVMARVRAERDRFVGFVLAGVEQIDPAERLVGSAKFIGPQRLQVNDHTIVDAKRIVISTGSRPFIAPEFVSLQERLITSDQLFDLTELPSSVAVIGAGVIGLELGQALHRLGVRVSVYGRGNKLAGLTDPLVRDSAVACLGSEMTVRPDCCALVAERDGDAVVVRSTARDGSIHREQFSMLLAATGRVPNLESLALEQTGLMLDKRGIPHFDRHTMQCGDSTIFIAGDVDGERTLLHEAVDQGRIAGDNAARFPAIAPGLRRAPIGVVFCDPQVAMVGTPFAELDQACVAIGSIDFAGQGRSRVMRQNRGLLRVYGEIASGRFIGAEMACPRAEHLAHLLAWACQSRMTVAHMLDMPFYHPVIEEGVRTALRDLQQQITQGRPVGEQCDACTPGM